MVTGVALLILILGITAYIFRQKLWSHGRAKSYTNEDLFNSIENDPLEKSTEVREVLEKAKQLVNPQKEHGTHPSQPSNLVTVDKGKTKTVGVKSSDETKKKARSKNCTKNKQSERQSTEGRAKSYTNEDLSNSIEKDPLEKSTEVREVLEKAKQLVNPPKEHRTHPSQPSNLVTVDTGKTKTVGEKSSEETKKKTRSKNCTKSKQSEHQSTEGMDGVMSSIPSASFISRCYHCLGPRTKARPLQRCSGCQLVSYCSKVCQKDNFYMHKYYCKEFKVVDGKNALFTKGPWEDHIAHLKVRAVRVQLREDYLRKSIFATPRVCHTCHESNPERLTDCKCASVCYCSKRCAIANKKHLIACSNIAEKEQEFSLHYMLMSYSQSIRYAVAFFKIFVTITSINLHIVSSCPMLDLEQWEHIVLHSSPKLLHLNIVFVVQNRKYKPSKKAIAKLNQPICKDCKAMKRSITYSIHKMPYHMYYSSEEYVEPNYVAIFGNTREMAANPDELKDDLNSDISYRNMLHTPQTYVILFDETKELVEQGLITINALKIPFSMIIGPRLNEYRAFSSIRAELGLANEGYNDRNYFTMVRRSHTV